MSQFHEHPDGWVYVRTPNGTYVDTRENFIVDFKWQFEPTPTGCVERLYDDSGDGAHRLMDDKSNHHWNGDIPWAFGDRAIAAIETLLQTQKERQAAAQAAALAAAVADVPLVVAQPDPPVIEQPRFQTQVPAAENVKEF